LHKVKRFVVEANPERAKNIEAVETSTPMTLLEHPDQLTHRHHRTKPPRRNIKATPGATAALLTLFAALTLPATAFVHPYVRHGSALGAGFGVDDVLDEALCAHLNVMAPNSIQAEALSLALGGKNVAVLAQTGSGKTLTFLLPILQSVLNREGATFQPDDTSSKPTAVVLAPTEMLAEQHKYVAEQLLPNLSGLVLFSTPSRFLEDLANNKVSLERLETVAIDEVDAVLYGDKDSSLTPLAASLLGVISKETQFILTTAYLTAAQEASLLQRDFVGAAFVKEQVPGGRSGVLVPTLRQCFKYFSGDKEDKLMNVIRGVEQDDWLSQGCTIVFCGSVSSAEQISSRIEADFGTSVNLLHDDLTAVSRNAVLAGLRVKQDPDDSNSVRIFLICTDIAARGLDVPNVRHVILFDVPTDISGFIHQAGRTARRGQQGLITCLVKTGSADYARYSHLHALKDASKLRFAASEPLFAGGNV